MARKVKRLTVGERIRHYRLAAGWSQTRLGDVIARDAAAVCRMEQGEREPTASQLEAIVGALGLSMSTFYGEPADEGRG